jgi:hypothetical protein
MLKIEREITFFGTTANQAIKMFQVQNVTASQKKHQNIILIN